MGQTSNHPTGRSRNPKPDWRNRIPKPDPAKRQAYGLASALYLPDRPHAVNRTYLRHHVVAHCPIDVEQCVAHLARCASRHALDVQSGLY